ncbi:hypothetical protein CsSME_00024423 [Camellia sinensis var. sinensis]
MKEVVILPLFFLMRLMGWYLAALGSKIRHIIQLFPSCLLY